MLLGYGIIVCMIVVLGLGSRGVGIGGVIVSIVQMGGMWIILLLMGRR